MVPARESAVNILLEIENEGSFSNKLLQEKIHKDADIKEANLTRELVYGVLENKRYIDSVISKQSSLRLKKIDPIVLQILRIGVYQLLYLDRIPESASVNESVNLAKKYSNKGAIGFVNGVLRSITRDKEKFKLKMDKIEDDDLSKSLSYPDYLVKLWEDQLGKDLARNLLMVSNSKAELNIRVNTLKTSINVLMDRLKDKGYKVRKGEYSKDCIIVENPSGITSVNEFSLGFFTIQDESSMLVTEALNPVEGSFILDMCAAPGGKVTHIAQHINDRGKILARDLNEGKINLIKENLLRLGIKSVKTEIYDAFKKDVDLFEKVDFLLLDAPCSGFGLIRRKPDIKWNRSVDEIGSLINIQERMLDIAAGYVKDRGTLVYSTCTINDDENLKQVKNFLRKHPNFTLQPFTLHGKTINESQKEGYLQLLPSIHGTDGFFIAKMIKNNSIL